eukprot:GAFH01000842.1.p1 GENE.GAFH01000842.1~~GAFH01000842.1.p1  ORF type:complete len:583 (-),score=150.39 GAFH01000842.1:857-2605(-)
MKVKVISRVQPDANTIHRNLNPEFHPFQRAREYRRALNAVKLDKIFAKPFIGQLFGHTDGVFSLARHPKYLNISASGSCDGEIRIWNMQFRNPIVTLKAHSNFVRGLAFSSDGSRMVSCSDDKTVKIWRSDVWGGRAGVENEVLKHIRQRQSEQLQTQQARLSAAIATQGRSVPAPSLPQTEKAKDPEEDDEEEEGEEAEAEAEAEEDIGDREDQADKDKDGGDGEEDGGEEDDDPSMPSAGADLPSSAAPGDDDEGAAPLVDEQDAATAAVYETPMEEEEAATEPVSTYVGQHAFHCVDHAWADSTFATSGETLEIWDVNRSTPLHSFSWGTGTISHCKYNRVEPHILATASSDRSIAIYDLRAASPLRKVVLALRTNCICWNPMEAFNFTCANEDTNLYTFDMRKLNVARQVHRDHTDAVMSVDYSPTGREFATGSYDRTVRIFLESEGASREVYYTKRMQRVFAINYTGDAKYVLSGSDDTNVRIWKAFASDPTFQLLAREKQHFNYLNALKEKFSHMPDIRRISKHRHVPSGIRGKTRLLHVMMEAQTRKIKNQMKYSKPGAVTVEPARVASIIAVEK